MSDALGDTHEDYVQMALVSNSDGLQVEDTYTEFAYFDL